MRQAFLTTLTDCLCQDPSIILLTSDTGFHVFDDFQQNFPDHYLNVGISEAAMISMAAGLALAGRKVLVYAIAPFVTLRCLEQIRVDLCYQNLPVVVVGVGAGLTYGPSGPADKGRSSGLAGFLDYYRNPIVCFVIYFVFMVTLPWLGALIGWDKPVLQYGMIPFLVGDLIKIVIAVALVPMIWKRVNRK